MKDNKFFEEEDTVRITIEMNGQDVYRNYAWKRDGNLESKGKAIEEMMESIENSYRHNF